MTLTFKQVTYDADILSYEVRMGEWENHVFLPHPGGDTKLKNKDS